MPFTMRQPFEKKEDGSMSIVTEKEVLLIIAVFFVDAIDCLASRITGNDGRRKREINCFYFHFGTPSPALLPSYHCYSHPIS